MQQKCSPQSGLSHPRVLAAFALGSAGVLLAMFSFAATAPERAKSSGLTSVNPSTAGSRAPASAVALGNWTVVSSPNRNFAQILQDVSCVSATDCFAVGSHQNESGVDQVLIEHWNGASWALALSSNTSATENNRLEDITCLSGIGCWAVGTYQNASGINQTLIESGNGIFSVVVSANTSAAQNNFLHGVSCNSSTDCWAVGHYIDASGFAQTLTEHFNGSSWTRVSSPNNTTNHNVLNSVSCTSASNCKAVGYSTNAGGFQQTLTERWDGSNWLIQSSPDTSPTLNNVLESVVCLDGSTCRAVGHSINAGGFQQSLILRWNGTIWAIVASPNTSATEHNVLQDVSCTSATNCRAVGYTINATGFKQTLTQRWNGTNWAIVLSPNTSATRNNNLEGVFCSMGINCWAVGSFDLASGPDQEQELIEHWDGTAWSIVTGVGGLRTNGLGDVTCPSETECWAVGSFEGAQAVQTLIERWNGTAWLVVPSPNTSATENNSLNKVTCGSESDCWALGAAGTEVLLQHWNGTAWSIVTAPSASDRTFLGDVACNSATDCWIVGEHHLTKPPAETFTAHWDGTSWTIIPSPNFGSHSNSLRSVACNSASDCWAVGGYPNDSFFTQTLMEHWDGKSWSVVSSPNVDNVDNELAEVTCASASECWAVGLYAATNGINQTLIERWDGNVWSLANSPNNGTAQGNSLDSVTCALPSYCWAVGGYDNNGVGATLTEQWDGSAWTIVPSPNVGPLGSGFGGTACASASHCWAVGAYIADAVTDVHQTLIEEFTLTAPLFAGAVSRMTHGDTDFDIDLPPTGTPGVECRINGAAVGEYTLVFKFEPTLTSVGGATVANGTGAVGSRMIDPDDAHNYIVHLTGVTNQQTITVTLTNVNDSAGHSSAAVSVSMVLLLGDVTGNRTVNSTDVSQAQFESGHAVTIDNFRADVTANGTINSSDVSTVQAQSGTGL